jgi:hypothetical protein
MKRLTIRSSSDKGTCHRKTTIEAVTNRLADYEDTGYEPAEIRELARRVKEQQIIIRDNAIQIDNLKEALL